MSHECVAEALEQVALELDSLPSYRFEGGEDHYGDDRIHAYGRDEEAERIAQWLRDRAAALRAAPTPCPTCDGAGIVDTSPPGVAAAPWLATDIDCPRCGGTGEIPDTDTEEH